MAFLDGSWVTCIIPCGSSSRRARDCFILGCSRYARSPKGQPLRSNLSSSRNLGAWAFSIAAPSRRRRLRQLSFLLWPSKLRFPDDTCDLNIYQNSNQKYNFGIISVCAHSLQCLLGRVSRWFIPSFYFNWGYRGFDYGLWYFDYGTAFTTNRK